MNSQLEINNLSKLYKKWSQKLFALKNISFSIQKGEVISLVGPSGSGKTTLGRILVGIVAFSSGEIIYYEEKLQFPFPARVRPKLQMVFQEPASSLNPRFPAIQLVSEPLILEGLPKKEAEKMAMEMIHKVGLKEEHLTRFPGELSGGEVQRIALARAVVVNPEVLILDETTSGLDPVTAREILNLIKKISVCSQSTVIFITHDLPLALKFASRIIFLFQGELAGELSREKTELSPSAETMLKLARVQIHSLEKYAYPNILS